MGPAVAIRISARAETPIAQSKATPKAIFAILITPPRKKLRALFGGRDG
jgi:hypothetical protein